MQKIELPSLYYLDHFLEMIHHLKHTHAYLLEDKHLAWIRTFESLSVDAKCLYIRIANRKGRIFDKSTFEFTTWDELITAGFIRPAGVQDQDLFLEWIKKEQIKSILGLVGIEHKKSAAKPALLEILKQHQSQIDLNNEYQNLIIHESYPMLHYMLFVFFGKIQESLILYTLRDLGVKKSHAKKSLKPKFDTLAECQSLYFYSTMIEIPVNLPPAVGDEAELKRDKVLLKAGEEARRNQELERALELYSLCRFYPATEKKARLLYELDRKDECFKALQEMMDNPGHDEELLFAEDFLARKFGQKKLSQLTETLRNARHLPIDESFFRHPEFGVVEHYKTLGAQAYFAENFLWSAVFGMVFHDQLLKFDRHSEFDYVPYDFKNKLKFEGLDKIDWELTLSQDFSEADLFQIDAAGQEMVRSFIKHAPVKALEHMLHYLKADYWGRHTGFPDLMVIENGVVKFIEVKAEGDSLKNSQLKQMRELERAGFEVEVLNVTYRYNPEQVYVVVDIETTGHLSPLNRITEVAAVKIKGKKVIDRFQTLVNPKRSIPWDIQNLTGITNEMVAGAPAFSEIAQTFEDFSQGAIFVAHNVGFDYNFIQKEFERLEKRFVRPYICTRAGMKKHFPKLESYSLKNLSQNFSISLTQHHRAMSDAEAASELLNLINEKRSQQEARLRPTLAPAPDNHR